MNGSRKLAWLSLHVSVVLLLGAATASARYGIIVVEYASESEGGSAVFSEDIKTPGEFTLADGEARTFVKTLRGVYHMTEISAQPSQLQSIVCDDPDGRTVVDVATRTATVHLEEDEVVTCRFTNEGSVQTTGAGDADLAVTKSDSFDPVAVSSVFSYTLIVHNNGPSAASDVVLTDTLPPGLGSVVAPGCSVTPTTVTCNAGTLGPGATSRFTVSVSAPPTPGVLVNSVSVASAASDPNSSNDTDSESTTVVGSGGNTQIVIRKSSIPAMSKGFVFGGDFGGFTLDDGESRVFPVDPGAYEVIESLSGAWVLNDISCETVGGSQVEVMAEDGVVLIDIEEEDTVICTYLNVRDASSRFGCSARGDR